MFIPPSPQNISLAVSKSSVSWNTIGKILIWFNPQISREALSCVKVIKQVGGKSSLFFYAFSDFTYFLVSPLASSCVSVIMVPPEWIWTWSWHDHLSVVGTHARICTPITESGWARFSIFPSFRQTGRKATNFQVLWTSAGPSVSPITWRPWFPMLAAKQFSSWETCFSGIPRNGQQLVRFSSIFFCVMHFLWSSYLTLNESYNLIGST